MKNYIGRNIDLKIRLNNHLKNLTGIDEDYFKKLNQDDLINLKTVLSDINNLLTLKMTISATNWICNYFNIDNSNKKDILKKVDDTKPNTNGFDICIIHPIRIIAEVKCVIPINKGGKYGGAQWNSILDDAYNLKNGKGKLLDTSEYVKFLFLIDIGEQTDQAIYHLLKESKGTSDRLIRANRHEIKKHILLLEKNDKTKLKLDKIYVKKIKID